jgi:hypothetical protein
MEQEELLPTEHEKVFMVQNYGLDRESFKKDLEALRRLVAVRDRDGAVALLQAMAGRY